jgi:EAL domain-containing protein (putative c-di-GMP-specific phosphodiesterase class I)
MSARNLLDEDFDRTVFDLLEDHDVDPSLLKLEITESAIMADPVRATSLLERLAAHGIDISIDDFGAGYTSIRQLRDLPITELKIDRSFVLAMETDPGSAMIVRSVVDLGHNLGLRTVAEGVESAAILDRLSSFGCDVAQGYYLSRPLPVPEFDRWWANWPGLLAIPT